jgi:acyl-CoA synthetase (AMP-forming)/AMP-acid ligase II
VSYELEPERLLSIARGVKLSEEPGLGALTLPGYLREVTDRFAEREAVVFPTGSERLSWSYADLWERAMQVARALIACGAGKDTRVGIMMTNRPEWIASLFGTALAGGVAVAFSTFSTPPELEYLLEKSGVAILLFEGQVLKRDFTEMLCAMEPALSHKRRTPLASLKFPFLRHIVAAGAYDAGAIEGWDEFIAHGTSTPRALVEATAASVQPGDIGVLFFSSGSTNKPKGILSTQRAVCIQLWRWRRLYGTQSDVRCWSANGFFWSGNVGMAIGTTLSSGGALVLQPTFDAAGALDLMQAERVNYPVAWPHQWAQMEAAPNWTQVDLSSLKYVDARTPLSRHKTVHTDWLEPRAAYGNTETFTVATAFSVNAPPERIAGSNGEPLPGNTVKIIDPLSGDVLPRGARGEIAVKGPTLMLGYIGLTADEIFDAEGFFRTGDGGYLDQEDRLFWEGRLTDIIKTGGANVSPLEVDGVLAAYPGIKLARTVGVPHNTLGEMVVACVVAHEGVALVESTIRDFARQRLASYKVPRRVLLFGEDEISLTGSAKTKSGELRKLAADKIEYLRVKEGQGALPPGPPLGP